MKKRLAISFLITFFIASSYSLVTPSPTSGSISCTYTKLGNPGEPSPPPECQAGGLGIGLDGFVFPLKTTKAVILTGSSKNAGPNSVWCYTKQTNCHHDYNAADIFTATGTIVVAAVPGNVTSAHDSGRVGHTVSILAGDKVFYYAHMGSLTVSQGQNVKAGDQLGLVGTSADAMGTDPHLHFDMLPNGGRINGRRVSCSGASCKPYPFINVQPFLVPAYNNLQ